MTANKTSSAKSQKSSSEGSDFWSSIERHQTAALIGATAAGAVLGLAAGMGRKFAVQAPTAMAGDWLEGLKAEHRSVMKLFDAIEETGNDARSRRKALLAKIKFALVKHALEEENVIYPALRESGEDEAARELYVEHALVKQYLYDLAQMPADSSEFLDTIRRFRQDLEEHISIEENELFPKLMASCDEPTNRKLTTLVNKEGLKIA